MVTCTNTDCKWTHTNFADSCQAKFCPECGTKLVKPARKVYGGVGDEHGTYKLTVVYEGEFYCSERAEECARKTLLGEEGYAPTKTEVKLVKKTATVKSHPYRCATCKEQDEDIYSDSKSIHCEWCNESNWIKR